MVTKIELEDRIEYLNEKGQYHREDGPAREFINGTKEWWINGKYHREDGPAVEWNDGAKGWCLNGNLYSEQQWQQEVINIKLERLKNYGN
jgi:hypothetical protein